MNTNIAAVSHVTIVDTISFDDVLITIGVNAKNRYFVWCTEKENVRVRSPLRSATLDGAMYLAYSMAEFVLKKIVTDRKPITDAVINSTANDFDIMDTVDIHNQSYCFGKSDSRKAYASFVLPEKGQNVAPVVLAASSDYHTAYYNFCNFVRQLYMQSS
ncbi:MAG TPA: hypothetical protein PKB13_08755 [Clostridia bacterium]|nr:hypothetical protein [Clostridia bacterium]